MKGGFKAFRNRNLTTNPEQGVHHHAGVGAVGERPLLAGLEGGTVGDHPVDGAELGERVAVPVTDPRQQATGIEQLTPEGGKGRLSGRPGANGLDQPLPEEPPRDLGDLFPRLPLLELPESPDDH